MVNCLDWLIGSGGREEGGTNANFTVNARAAAGDGDDEACHQRLRVRQPTRKV